MKETPLFIACKLGHEKIASKLLDYGADYKAKDFLGRSCKGIARRTGNKKIAQMINMWKMSHPK